MLISFATADGNLLPFVSHRADCLHPSTERGLNMQYCHRKGRAAGTKRAFSTILILYSGLHVVLTLLLVELALLLRSGVLVLLVLGDEIVHVALRLGELHLVHALTVYQCRKAFRRNIPVKYSATRLNISWIAVELPAKDTAIFSPFGGMSQIPLLMLFGIHSTK